MTEDPATSRLGAVLNFVFGYQGRNGRAGYWLGMFIAWAVPGFLAAIAEDVTAGTGDIGRHVAFAIIIGTLLWLHSAASVKRLHDRDKSAWWYLLYGIAPALLFVTATLLYAKTEVVLALVLYVVSIAGLMVMLVELGFLRGTPGPNRYGPGYSTLTR